MKIVILTHPTVASSQFVVVADSALVPNNRPVFLPPLAAHWQASFYVAIRISRLGKTVSAKFAHRYYDAATVAMRLLPTDLANAVDGSVNLFDGAVTIGQWVDVDTFAQQCGNGAITINGIDANNAPNHLTFNQQADNAIVALSSQCTIKMGDILLIGPQLATINVSHGTNIAASLPSADEPCLIARIK